jgi:hypothetical protein
LNFYRLPIYQKRVHGIENHLPNSRTRSPSPNRSIFASRRRHSTPLVAPKYLIDINSPPPNRLIKYYHSYPRRGCATREQNSILESPSRPIPFVKFRHQEERIVRLVPTPTSVKSFNDIMLPVAKKNRNTIVENLTSIPSDIQSINHSLSSMKRGQKTSSNSVSNADSHDKSFSDNVCLKKKDFRKNSFSLSDIENQMVSSKMSLSIVKL